MDSHTNSHTLQTDLVKVCTQVAHWGLWSDKGSPLQPVGTPQSPMLAPRELLDHLMMSKAYVVWSDFWVTLHAESQVVTSYDTIRV